MVRREVPAQGCRRNIDMDYESRVTLPLLVEKKRILASVYSLLYKLFVVGTTQISGGTLACKMKKNLRAPSIAEARVYRELKSAITSGLFQPGSVLVQQELCEKFRASRTPVRDALTHLQAEGLVIAIRNKGVVVRDFSPKDVHDIYEIRALLESAAAKDAAGRLARADLNAIIKKASALNAKKDFSFGLVRDLGSELHHLIIAAAGNLIMKDLLNRMDTLIEVSRIPFRGAVDRLREINQEHIKIAQALLAADGDLAADLMKKHFALTKEAHLKILMGSGYGLSKAANQR
jgi:DNA-binding GntR family transcriptional regulator